MGDQYVDGRTAQRDGVAARRSYRMLRRQEFVDQTRERIVRAAFELHRDVGPAYATISAIAAHAGVERHTVYRHFPDLVSLFRACTAHGMETTGLPEPAEWAAIDDVLARLRVALTRMYAYWRANERLVANFLRDMPVTPALAEGAAAYRDQLGTIWQSVLEPWESVEGETGERARALVGTALEFSTWQSLTMRYGLSDEAAVEAMVGAIKAIAGIEAQAAG